MINVEPKTSTTLGSLDVNVIGKLLEDVADKLIIPFCE